MENLTLDIVPTQYNEKHSLMVNPIRVGRSTGSRAWGTPFRKCNAYYLWLLLTKPIDHFIMINKDYYLV